MDIQVDYIYLAKPSVLMIVTKAEYGMPVSRKFCFIYAY